MVEKKLDMYGIISFIIYNNHSINYLLIKIDLNI